MKWHAGRPIKKRYGPWMFKAFGVLTKLKMLRGTPLDVFGYTAERRLEVALIANYKKHLEVVVANINNNSQNTAASTSTAMELLALPLSIRGFGPVKISSAEDADKQALVLLSALTPGSKADTQHDGRAA